MSDYETVALSVSNEVATLTLDRPEKKNAMSQELLAEMDAAIKEVEGEVQTMVVTGVEDVFSSGMDFERYFRDARAEGPQAVREANEIHKNALARLRAFPQPTIAKVNGWALGGGYMIAALCDLAIAAEDAKFGLSEINFGIPPGGGTMWSAANTMNRRDAMYYAVTGEPFPGDEAEKMGVVNEAVPREDLDKRVDELVETLLEKNRLALEYSKIYYNRVTDMNYERAHDYELAKGEEMKYLQGYEFLEEGVGQFNEDRYRPGQGENYERSDGD
jgi:trans-feruloyl-CoA hydratase/vanillin synthase